jgi:Ca2+/Na+ antiporter
VDTIQIRPQIIVLLLAGLLAGSAACAQDGAAAAVAFDWVKAVQAFLLLLPVLAILAGVWWYLRRLHNIFHRSCVEGFKLELFAKSPMGLPEGTMSTMLAFTAGMLVLYLFVAIVIKASLGEIDLSFGGSDQQRRDLIAGLGSIGFLLIVIAGAIFYMQRLQTRFFKGCMQTDQLQKFFDAPAGLPAGTVRAVLALMIVAVSLFFIIFQVFVLDRGNDIPQGLMTLLTAVVAFYFANRAGTQAAAGAFALESQSLQTQRDAAVRGEEQTRAQGLIGKVAKALQVTRAASQFLPPERRQQFDALAERLQAGLSVAENLAGGRDPGGAAVLMDDALSAFSRSNPAFQAIERALPVFTRVLGVGVPAFGLVAAIVGVGVRIGSARREQWKLRVLHAPLTPATLTVDTVDGLMAQRLLRSVPPLARAFAEELNAGRDDFLARAANDFIGGEVATLWQDERYRFTQGGDERFDSQLAFEESVYALRRLIADEQLAPYVEPEWLGPVNSYDSLVAAVDRLHEDEEARARLDEIMLVTDGLMSEGQPVLQIMEKIEEELQREPTSRA